MLTPALSTRPPDSAASYGYPATAFVFLVQNDEVEFHFIWYGANPSSDFANAPNGSYLWDGTNFNLYIKSGTPGAKDGTWKSVALS
jgi:hypothetical protein